MKISEIIVKLKKLFKKDENFVSDLTCPENTIKIPSRKAFNNDALIDSYKAEYLNALNNMHYFDNLIMEATSLNEHVKMISDLLFTIVISEDNINDTPEEHLVKHLINYEKLKLYVQDLFSLQNEAIARIIALLEIRKEAIIIPKRKKETINNVINRLYISLNTLLASQTGIINDMKRYVCEKRPNDDESVLTFKLLIIQKINHLNWLQKLLPQDAQNTISKDENEVFYHLASIEKSLEEYTYTHKNEVSPEAKQNAIDNILAIPFDTPHKEEILKQIANLEIKYRAFYEYRMSPIYGEIPVDETDLSILYSIKFNALLISEEPTLNPSLLNLDSLDSLEHEYYQNIIYKAYEDIIMGRNETFNKLFKDDFEKAINHIKEIFKNKLSNVLNDYILLNLLFAFDNEKGLYNLFKSKISAFTLPRGLYVYEPIEITDNIPLETFCYLESAIDESDENKDLDFEFTKRSLYELYLIYLKNYPEPKDVYRIPEGITSIKISKSWDKFSMAELALLKKIRKDAKNKIVYFPNSLEQICDDLFIDVPIKGIVFNEGLKNIYCGNWLAKFKSLNFPSTIKKISITAYIAAYTESITFNISQDNAPVLNADFLLEIFNNFQNFGWELNEAKNKIMPPQDLRKIIIHLNEINENLDIDLSDLSFDYDVQKDGDDIKNAYVIKLIKHIYYLLTQVRKKFNLMQKVLPENERIEISDKVPEFLRDIEILDRKFKDYRLDNSRQNADIIIALEKRLKELNYQMDFSKPMPYFDFATELAPYEAMIRLYNYYHKDDNSILNDTFVNYFYKLKFLYLTKGDVVYPFIDDEMDDVELDCYQNFIGYMYDRLKVNKTFTGNNFNAAIIRINELFEEVLKNGKDAIDSEKILQDFYLLNLFLSFKDFKRLLTFAKSFKINPQYEDPVNALVFEKYLPFSTVCMVEYYISIYAKESQVEMPKSVEGISDDFLELFHLIYINYEAETHKDNFPFIEHTGFYYFIPEGITSIGAVNTLDSTDFYKAVIKGLTDDCEGKNIVMPNSLKSLKDDFVILPCKSITLNEGLQELDLVGYCKSTQSKKLIIPSTVKKINYNYIPKSKFSEIVFNNFNFENDMIIWQILLSYLSFEKLPSGKLRGVLPFNIVFHYDDLNNDIIIGPYFNVLSLDVYSFITKNQLIKKALNDIEEEVKLLRGTTRERTE